LNPQWIGSISRNPLGLEVWSNSGHTNITVRYGTFRLVNINKVFFNISGKPIITVGGNFICNNGWAFYNQIRDEMAR